MENDRISYTYSEKIGGENYSSKQISVSYTSDCPEGEGLENAWMRIKGFVHDRFEEQKAAHCKPTPTITQPPPDPANYNDPRNYPPNQAPMPTQPQPFPTPGVPAVGQAPYVPKPKGGDYIVTLGKHKGTPLNQIEDLLGYVTWCKQTIQANADKPNFGLKHICGYNHQSYL